MRKRRGGFSFCAFNAIPFMLPYNEREGEGA
ncbi:MAG: hypothetical protein YPKNTGVA_002574 [Candidatus Fervidibacter sp.]|jgi:hypothetical protein